MPTKTSIFGTRIRSGSIPPSALSGGVVSSSAQITALLPSGTLSSSAQVNYSEISNIPSGIVSSSAQVKSLLPAGSVSSSTASSPSQGTVRVTINGVNTDVDTGLQTGDSPTFSGLTVDGTVTAKEFYTQVVSSSIIYQSGSTKFGDSSDDVMSVTGSIGISGSMIISSSGNVGIGTTTPGTKLDVSGNIRISGNGTLSGYGGVEFANVSGFGLKVASLAYEVNSSNGTTNYATINSSGNVGIGTGGNISSRLHVSGTAVTANSDYGTFTVEGGNVSGLTFGYDSSNNYSWIYSRTFGVTSRPLAINGTLYVGTLGGSVGIGTTTPSQKLQIVGTLAAQNGIDVSDKSGVRLVPGLNSGSIQLVASDGSSKAEIRGYDNGSGPGLLSMWTANASAIPTERMRIDSSGNVGIGTTSPIATLHVSGSDTGFRVSGTTRSQIMLSTPTTNWQIETPTSTGNVPAGALGIIQGGVGTRFVISGSGNVGIGTTTPASKLEIAGGNLRLSQGQGGAGSFGRLEWQNALAYSSTVRAYIEGRRTSEGDNGFIDFATSEGTDIAPVVRMTISRLGDIGIGTTSPTYKMDISTVGGSAATTRLYGNDQANVRLRLENVGTGGRTWELVGGLPGANNTNFSLYDVTGTSTRLTVESTGNVGIGTTAPYSQLHLTETVTMGLAGDARPAFKPTNWGYSTSYRALLIGSPSTMYGHQNTGSVTVAFNYDPIINANSAFNGDGREIIFRNGTQFVTPNSANTSFNLYNLVLLDDNVGIGVADPSSFSSKLVVAGNICATAGNNLRVWESTNTTYVQMNSPANRVVRWVNDAGTEYMRIDNLGNVGIGTTSPSAKLHVTGGIGNGGPMFKLEAASSNGGFDWFSSAYASNMTSGNNVIHIFGKESAVKNSGYVGFNYQGNNSNSNFLTFGLYDVNNILNITGEGNVGIGTTTPSFKFHVQVPSGANRDILIAGVEGVSNGLFVSWNHSSSKTHVKIADIPTSAAGLPTGTLYSDGGTIKIA